MRKIIWTVVILMIVGGGLAANAVFNAGVPQSGSDSENTQKIEQFDNFEAAAVDPCVVFVSDELEKVFSTSFVVGLAQEKTQKTSDDLAILTCKYISANDGSAEGIKSAYELELSIENYKSNSSSQARLKELRAAAVSGEQLEGIGESAFRTAQGDKDLIYWQEDKQLMGLVITRKAGLDKKLYSNGLIQLLDAKF